MKVLLTGATGFIGRHVLQSMRDRDIPFVAVGRIIPPGCIETEFIQADLLAPLDFVITSYSIHYTKLYDIINNTQLFIKFFILPDLVSPYAL